jgi:peptidoglycan/xylan/chitin deacetylase (PgdA/CDA1 family)
MRPLVLFGVDVETDVGSFTPFYEGVRVGMPRLLGLFREKGITATFFFTGESARAHPAAAREAAGDNEVGCHSLYHETLGDELFPLPNVRAVLPEEVELRIRRATEWVAEASGVRPVSFRCPRLWGSTRVLNVLEALGYIADATYPMYFHRGRFEPYHPARESWLERGSMRILEVPNFADMQMASTDAPLERDRDHWPLFRTGDGSGIYRCVESFLRFTGDRGLRQVLCFYFHPWEFVEVRDRYDFGEATVMPYPFLTENCGETALQRLSLLIDHLKSRGCRFMRADELARAWDGIAR